MQRKELNKTFMMIDPFSAGTNFIRQNLTSVDGRQILTTKVDPRTVRVNIFLLTIDS